MKISRSTKCSLVFSNDKKLETLISVLDEYGKIVNVFINHFWSAGCPKKAELLKPIVDLPKTWLSARLRKVAAREAIDMISASRLRWKDKAKIPVHKGKRMYVSCTIAELLPAKKAKEFDCWLHLSSIGNGVGLQLPIRLHKHFNDLAKRGGRCNSYIVTKGYVQFVFEIETGPKLQDGKQIGVDTGIKTLAAISDGKQLGRDVEAHVTRIKRCQHGSKGQQKARRALRQRMDEVAKETVSDGVTLVVAEQLKNMNKGTKLKRRLSKNMRRSLGSWAYRYWLGKLERTCEDRRSTFRSVLPQYTSQRCPACGHTERGNRSGEDFLCRKCGHADNADVNAAKNILDRFLTGPYGAGYKPRAVEETSTV